MSSLLFVILSVCAADAPPPSGVRWAVPHLELEATRLEVRSGADWKGVLRLQPATSIVVAAQGRPGVPRRFLAANDAELFVLDDRHQGLPSNVRRVLLEMASARVDYERLLRGALYFTHDHVRIAAEGVFSRDVKVAETPEVIERIPRGDVLLVALPSVRRGSTLGAIVGATGGFLIGFRIAVGIALENQCGASCADEEALMGLAAVGLPVAGGVLGYHAISRTTQTIVYRAGEATEW